MVFGGCFGDGIVTPLNVYISLVFDGNYFTKPYINISLLCLCVCLCPTILLALLCLLTVVQMVVVLTYKTVFPLLIILPNLQTHLCWMDSDITILITPMNPFGQPFLMPSNSEWEAMVVVKNPTAESKSGFQSGTNEPTKIIPLGDRPCLPFNPLYPNRSCLRLTLFQVGGSS